MTPTTLITCRDCTMHAPDTLAGWLRCPNCEATYCGDCARAHHETATGECDSNVACTTCGYTCLVEI